MHRLVSRKGSCRAEKCSWYTAQDKYKGQRLLNSELRLTLINFRRYHGCVKITSVASPSRFYATSLRPSNEQAKASNHGLATPQSNRKSAKVDLRPGPLKPASASAKTSQDASSSGSQSPKQEATEKKAPDVVLQEKEVAFANKDGEAGISSSSSSIIDTARRDIENAMQHGIMRPPPEGAGRIRLLWHQLKELFKFYVAGIKLIYFHNQTAKKIRARVKAGGNPISRWERQFLITHRADLIKLVPFLLMLLIIEEIIPLVVLYAPGLLPSTCILPSQRERILKKRRQMQIEVYKDTALLDTIKNMALSGPKSVHMENLDAKMTKILCSVLGLPDRRITYWNRTRLEQRLQSIAEDDQLLVAEAKGEALAEAEVAEALWERGLPADIWAPTEQRLMLSAWLNESGSLTSQSNSVSLKAYAILRNIDIISRETVLKS